MNKSQPMFPGFHLQTLRRKSRSPQQILAEKLALPQQKSFKEIGEVFEKFIPRQLLKPEKEGAMSRRRPFSRENTFGAFFSQVLDADGGCKEVIRKLQSYVSLKGIRFPSSSTSSYCTAHKKLDIQTLAEIFDHTACHPEGKAEIGRLNGRRVIVVDGTGVSMPDTPRRSGHKRLLRSRGADFPPPAFAPTFLWPAEPCSATPLATRKATSYRCSVNSDRPSSTATFSLATKDSVAILTSPGWNNRALTVLLPSPGEPRSAEQAALKKLGPNDLLIAWQRPRYTDKLSYPNHSGGGNEGQPGW